MKNIPFFYLSILLLFSSCSSVLKLQPNISKVDGYQQISIPEAKTTIQYPSDYWFHDFDLTLFPNANPDFLKGLQLQAKRQKATMILAGHTTIPPYFSSVLLIYPKKLDLLATMNGQEDQFRNDHQGSNFEKFPFDTKAGTFQQLSYQLQHPTLKTQAHYIEYYGHLKDKTIRVIFWTIDNYPRSLTNESEKIIKSLAMEWY